MKKYSSQYSQYQTENNYNIAVTLLYGFLGDAVSEEKKISILKKLQLLSLLNLNKFEEIRTLYPKECAPGGSFHDALDFMQNDEFIPTVKETPAKGLWKQNGMCRYLDHEFLDPLYEEFHKGMGELVEVLEEHAKDMKLKEPNAKNYYNFLYKQIKDGYEGTLEEKVEESPWYGDAIGMTAKVAFPTGPLHIDTKTGEVKIGEINGSSVEKVLKETADLGLVEMITGGARLQQKTDECLKSGRVSRQELLREYEQQNKRFEKLSTLSKAKEQELMKKNVIQNGLEEFTNGARGVGIAVRDTEGRCKALEAGYPVEDLPLFGAFYVQLQETINKYNNMKNAVDAEQDLQKKHQMRLEMVDLELQKGMMNDCWNMIINHETPLTIYKRNYYLTHLNVTVQGLKKSMGKAFPNALNNFEQRVNERKEATLNNGDTVLLASDATDMLSTLNEVDPKTLFTSSSQFNAFKRELKELAEMEAAIDPEDRPENPELLSKKRDVIKKAQEYLRYKDRQISGPKGKKHKRSELEMNRVQTVDGIYNRLLWEIKRVPDAILNEQEIAIVANADNNRLLEGPGENKALSYESYINLHTGKGAMSGTKEEMVDDMAKTLAAQMLKSQEPPKEFNINEIHKAADIIRKKFDLVNINEEALRKALETPDCAKQAAATHYRTTYMPTPEEYEKYISNIQTLYANMEVPAANSVAYKAVFDAVKRAASLPALRSDIDEKKLQNLTADINAEIFSAIDKYVQKHAKGMGPHDRKVMHVLNTLSNSIENSEPRVFNIVKTIREATGITDHTAPGYIRLSDYGADGKYKLPEKLIGNAVDPDMKAEMTNKVAKTISQMRTDMKDIKDNVGEAKDAKDVTEKKTHKKLEEVKLKPLSREV